MPFDIRSSAHPSLLTLCARGAGSGAEARLALDELQAHAGYYYGVPILVDLGGLECGPPEVRAFAGLFATAFPSSLLALVGRPGESYEPVKDIARLSLSRGGTVAAFADDRDALAWLSGAPGAAGQLDALVIPYTLREKIETTQIDMDGHDYALRLDSAAGRPLLEPEVAEVTVSTDYGGTARHATVDVRLSSLDDEDYVVLAVVRAMKAVLGGSHVPSRLTASAAHR